MISDNAFEKAIAATAGKPETPAPEPVVPAPAPVETPAPEQKASETPAVEQPATPAEEQEWDGDVNKLDPKMQPWAKKAQRHLTKKAMAASEEIRLGQEFKNLQGSADWQAYQAWKKQLTQGSAGAPQAPAPQQPISSGVTQQEWEEAQLDPSGVKFNALVERKVAQQIQQAAQVYGAELQQLRTTQQVTSFQQTLSDFVDVNPDAVDLHQKGIMKPFLDEELASGRHRSYEAAINAAYERGRAIRDAIREDAMNAAQARIAEKKNGVVSTGTSVGEANVAYVDKGSTFDEAFNFAIQGKKVKVKAKQ